MKGHQIRNQNEMHFLTLTIVGWVDVFSRKVYRDIVIESLRFCQQEKGLTIYAYVIMSNHLHLIAQAEEGKKLSDILRDFKQFTAKRILAKIELETESRRNWMRMVFEYHARHNSNNRKLQFWQQHNHPVELISPKWILQKLAYIHANPVRAGLVEQAEDYIYSSAKYYRDGEGVLEVTCIDLGFTEGYVFMG